MAVGSHSGNNMVLLNVIDPTFEKKKKKATEYRVQEVL